MLIQEHNPAINPSILSEEYMCDLCASKQDLIDLTCCPEGNGYYCQKCMSDGDVASYLKRVYKYTKEQIINFLNRV